MLSLSWQWEKIAVSVFQLVNFKEHIRNHLFQNTFFKWSNFGAGRYYLFCYSKASKWTHAITEEKKEIFFLSTKEQKHCCCCFPNYTVCPVACHRYDLSWDSVDTSHSLLLHKKRRIFHIAAGRSFTFGSQHYCLQHSVKNKKLCLT